jgi:hypothetical protein
LLLIFSVPSRRLAEALMDSETAVVFVLVTILTFLFALWETPTLRQ